MKQVLILTLSFLSFATVCFSQKTVGLDNWYNRETHSKTGKIFHYTWNDSNMSGFSQLGDVFIKHGAVLKTIESKPNAESMKGIDVYIIVDPDTIKENPTPNYIEAAEIEYLRKWVAGGGILLIMANDGPNCELTNFNQLAGVFGFRFHPQSLNPVPDRDFEMGAETNLPKHPIFSGVSKI